MLAASPIALPFPSTGGELRLPSLRVPEGAARVEGEERHGKARLRWERKLIRRTLQGDERAFGELYRAYAPGIFARVLMPRLGNRQAAEDAFIVAEPHTLAGINLRRLRRGKQELQTRNYKAAEPWLWDVKGSLVYGIP